MNTWIRELEQAWARGPHYVTPWNDHIAVMIGLDEMAPGRRYDWDGLRRSTDPRGEELIIQVTLAGSGRIHDGAGNIFEIGPGQAFITKIPSRHRYYLPTGTSGWRFWWTQILCPEVLRRVSALFTENVLVLDLVPGSDWHSALLACSARLRRGGYRDALEVERDALVIAIETQRRHLSAGQAAWNIEASIRERILADLTKPPDVAELASAQNCSPSSFGHRFRSITGRSPGQAITAIRIEVVQRMLLHSQHDLAAIALACGFADANHLCKVFRRQVGTSPGRWRKGQASSPH
jgi:AraC-like DNA-binding protein